MTKMDKNTEQAEKLAIPPGPLGKVSVNSWSRDPRLVINVSLMAPWKLGSHVACPPVDRPPGQGSGLFRTGMCFLSSGSGSLVTASLAYYPSVHWSSPNENMPAPAW